MAHACMHILHGWEDGLAYVCTYTSSTLVPAYLYFFDRVLRGN